MFLGVCAQLLFSLPEKSATGTELNPGPLRSHEFNDDAIRCLPPIFVRCPDILEVPGQFASLDWAKASHPEVGERLPGTQPLVVLAESFPVMSGKFYNECFCILC